MGDVVDRAQALIEAEQEARELLIRSRVPQQASEVCDDCTGRVEPKRVAIGCRVCMSCAQVREHQRVAGRRF